MRVAWSMLCVAVNFVTTKGAVLYIRVVTDAPFHALCAVAHTNKSYKTRAANAHLC